LTITILQVAFHTLRNASSLEWTAHHSVLFPYLIVHKFDQFYDWKNNMH